MTEQQKLDEAIECLERADRLIQEVLGNTEQCFDMHMSITGIADDLVDIAATR